MQPEGPMHHPTNVCAQVDCDEKVNGTSEKTEFRENRVSGLKPGMIEIREVNIKVRLHKRFGITHAK